HRLGVGTPRDVGQAAALYRKPAEQGNPLAQYNLGEAYRSGYGLPQNLSEAANWFAKAAARGNPLAQYRLGVLLLKGQGVALDPAEALLWLTVAEPRLRAAETNPSWSGYAPEVKDALARLPSLRAQATKRLRAPELERVRRDAAAWKPSS
ncbi:MAG: sel1 repeat family protein, partial [Alphaproteobacteria bacterium]|nr:sel1 repeat family protein [Alphaproteobacteria bacterium]